MATRKKGNMGKILVTVVVAVLLVGVLYWGISQTAIGEADITKVTSCPDSTGVLTVNAVDALQAGTAIGSPTITASKDGSKFVSVTSGTTTFAVGSKLDIFVSKAGYLDDHFTATMECGGLVIDAPLYQSTSDNPAIRIKNDDGDFMTDNIAGAATNQTNLAAGESFQLVVEFSGTNLESSGDGVYVIEFPAGSSANITTVTMSDASTSSLPTVHTTQNAGSYIAVFDIDAIVGAAKSTHTLEVSLTSGKDLAGGVYTDWYAKQWFTDDDGTLSYGVEDSDGTLKYENTLDFDFYINAA